MGHCRGCVRRIGEGVEATAGAVSGREVRGWGALLGLCEEER